MGEYSKLIGKQVEHKTLGRGVINRLENNKIYIQFTKISEEKHFVYPECFHGFIKLVDNADANIIEVAAAKRRFEKVCQQKQKQLDLLGKLEENYGTPKVSKKNTTMKMPAFLNIEDFIQEYSSALYREIAFLKNDGEKKIHLTDGKFVVKSGDYYTYLFQADTELNYPGDTQITISTKVGSISGYILYCEDFSVTLAASSGLGKTIPEVDITVDSWRLLEMLCKRLTELQERPVSPIVSSLVCDGNEEIQQGQEIVRGQEKAIEKSLTQPITFVWGPPGTGKTETLSRIALEHMKRGNRVLMVSYSNVSVDGAALRVFSNDSEQRPGKIVRYGYAKNQELVSHPFLEANKLALKNHPEKEQELNRISEELSAFTIEDRSVPKYVELKKQMQGIKEQLKKAAADSVSKAQFVATTVSKATVDQVIYQDCFDVVLFDEASMAYIPQIVFAASLARRHFVCLGDFSQLPPIVQSSKESILNADIFQYCGITDAVASECGHKWLCMLDIQYRMDPRIAGFASMAMYKGLLSSAPYVKKNREAIVNSQPFSGHPIVLADLSGMMSVCSKLSDSSRINPLSAFISFGIALDAARKSEVGIITPYHAQSRLLHALARDFEDEFAHKITCATVHQFQGSEQDVILYDAVDCYRQRYPSMLLTSSYNNYANRLFNVAMTRAKGKFIAVANVSYFENKLLSPELMFEKLIKHCKHTPKCVGGDELLNTAKRGKDKFKRFQMLNTELGDEYFFNDILDAKKDIRINIPGTIKGNERYTNKLIQVLFVVKSRGVKVILRTESKENLPEGLREYAVEMPNICDPITIIDKGVTWFGEPHSSADFFSEGQILTTRWRPLIRIEGKNTANCLYSLLEMNLTADRAPNMLTIDGTKTLGSYIQTYKRCPQCGSPMRLKQARKGSFFLGCSSYPTCDYTEKVSKKLVEDYLSTKEGQKIRCEYDHTSLEARVGPEGVYLQCCGMSKHKYALNQI